MGKHLRREEIEPSLVLCSSAVRARETLQRVDPGGQVRIEPELYGASAEGLLERLREVPDSVDSVMLVGHNPAMQSLALSIAGGGAKLADVERKFPTGALATLTFEGDWRELEPARAELVDFVKPKHLA